MDVANILADHSYHKKQSKWAPKDKLLGIAKRRSSGRKPDPSGDKLTVLNKKKVYVGLKRSRRRPNDENDEELEIQPVITKVTVPRGETFMNLMGKQSLDPKHKWEVYEQVAAVVTMGTDDKQDTGADDNRIKFKRTDESSESVPPMEARFVDMGDVNQQFSKPNSAELYSVMVPEW